MLKYLIPRSAIGLIVGISMLFISCGKKTEEDKKNASRFMQPQITDLEKFLEKQEINCEQGQVCPNYISKVVVIQGKTANYCTGFLVERNIIATSSSCLGNALRVQDLDCSQDVHLFFPRMYNGPAERVGCKRVIQASQFNSVDPILWRDDVAFLELDRSLYKRRNLEISRSGMPEDLDKNGYSIWRVEKIDEFIALIKLDEKCEAVQNSYINPLASNESSPNMIFAGCANKTESSGAPILARGRVRGIVSAPLSATFREQLNNRGLLKKPLKDIVHATNFACAPTIYDPDVRDEAECTKALNISVVDRLRADMLNTELLFGKVREELQSYMDTLSKYIKFGVRLISQDDKEIAEIKPICFKQVDQWIGEFSTNRNVYSSVIMFPNRSYKKIMDVYGRIIADEIDHGDIEFNIQFSPKFLRTNKKSNVYLWNDDSNQTFKNLSEDCSSLF